MKLEGVGGRGLIWDTLSSSNAWGGTCVFSLAHGSELKGSDVYVLIGTKNKIIKKIWNRFCKFSRVRGLSRLLLGFFLGLCPIFSGIGRKETWGFTSTETIKAY